MTSKDKSPRQLAIGLRVKTGRATAVVMAGPASAARVVAQEFATVGSCDSRVPPAFACRARASTSRKRSYRAEGSESCRARHPGSAARAGRRSPARAGSILGSSVIAGSATDPESIRNPHMRAHAREGQLFPQALAAAASTIRIPASTIVESKCSPARPRGSAKRPKQSSWQ